MHSCILIFVAWINITQNPSLFMLIYIFKWIHFLIVEYFLVSAKILSYSQKRFQKAVFTLPYPHTYFISNSCLHRRQEAVWHSKAVEFCQGIVKGYILSHLTVIFIENYDHPPHNPLSCLTSISCLLRPCKLQQHLQTIAFIQLNEKEIQAYVSGRQGKTQYI